MSLVDRFETFIERLMERTFTRATRSHVEPVEIGKRLVRAMESRQSVGVEGQLVPNVYDVYLSAEDYQHFAAARASLAQNLASHLGRVARQRQFYMMSQPIVQLARDDKLRTGDIRVEPQLRDVESPASEEFQHTALLPALNDSIPSRPSKPSLMLDGQSFTVLRSPTRLGRLPDNDIVLDDKRVSRHHAEFVLQGGRWVLRDTGSTNGTAVNGKIITEAPLKPGDSISLGGLQGTWEQ